MNNQELLAVANLVNACDIFNHFTFEAVAAAKGGVPLILPEQREQELHMATVSVRVALGRLQPRIDEAITQLQKGTKKRTVPDFKSV